jgi:hypothetical protein
LPETAAYLLEHFIAGNGFDTTGIQIIESPSSGNKPCRRR